MPSESTGIRLAPETAEFAASVAATPSGAPVPNAGPRAPLLHPASGGVAERGGKGRADAGQRAHHRADGGGACDERRCLFVGFVAPHFPLVVPRPWFDLYPPDRFAPVKLHPRDGHPRHPWVEAQNAFMDSEGKFRDEAERLAAMSSYFGLCSLLDHNVGRVLTALAGTGAMQTTTVVYTSDHGDNAGARGLWGKSNMYEESAAVPMIMAGPGTEPGACETPVSLIDLSETVIEHFGARLAGERPGRSLRTIASEAADPERVVFSEYHAAGAVSGAFMLRTGRWKYIYYVGFEPELFDLDADPEETTDR